MSSVKNLFPRSGGSTRAAGEGGGRYSRLESVNLLRDIACSRPFRLASLDTIPGTGKEEKT
jgi:hypothetical protein